MNPLSASRIVSTSILPLSSSLSSSSSSLCSLSPLISSSIRSFSSSSVTSPSSSSSSSPILGATEENALYIHQLPSERREALLRQLAEERQRSSRRGGVESQEPLDGPERARTHGRTMLRWTWGAAFVAMGTFWYVSRGVDNYHRHSSFVKNFPYNIVGWQTEIEQMQRVVNKLNEKEQQ